MHLRGFIAVGAILFLSLAGSPGGAVEGAVPAPVQDREGSEPSPSSGHDPYESPEIRALVEKAKRALEHREAAIESYEARIHERSYLGVRGERLSRSRAIYERERAGHVRWEGVGRQMVRWDGAAEAVLGMPSQEHPEWEEDLVESLAGALSRRADFLYDPHSDGIGFGVAGFSTVAHPLGDEAEDHYRYAAGDTLRIFMPEIDREVTLAEVVVEPRRVAYDVAHASLWVDVETGHVARVLYRAARPWNMGLDTERNLLGFAGGLEAYVEGVAIDYALFDLEWWLPRRHAFQVSLRARPFLEVPAIIEWSARDYRLNEPATETWNPEAFPDDWVVREGARSADGGGDSDAHPDSIRWVTVTPPADTLHAAGAIAGSDGPMGEREEVGVFLPEELEGLWDELEGFAPQAAVPEPDWSWGLENRLLRYNRVEGLSAGVRGEVPLDFVSPRWAVGAEIRLGMADLEPRGEVVVWRDRGRGRVGVAAYRRLDEASDWENHTGLSSSVAALVAGSDRGDYHHVDGMELAARHVPGRVTLAGRLFVERHRSVERNTDFHLTGLFGSRDLRENPAAVEADWLGTDLTVGAYRGTDPRGTRLSGAARVEAAHGGAGEYLRLGAEGAVAHRWGPFDLGFQGGAGRAWGDLPIQREFALVGPSTLRGPRAGSLRGASYWFARAEGSYRLEEDIPGVRAAVFLDAGWAGQPGSFSVGATELHPGVGLSIADGTVRLDLANPWFDEQTTRMYVYLDGVL